MAVEKTHVLPSHTEAWPTAAPKERRGAPYSPSTGFPCWCVESHPQTHGVSSAPAAHFPNRSDPVDCFRGLSNSSGPGGMEGGIRPQGGAFGAEGTMMRVDHGGSTFHSRYSTAAVGTHPSRATPLASSLPVPKLQMGMIRTIPLGRVPSEPVGATSPARDMA